MQAFSFRHIDVSSSDEGSAVLKGSEDPQALGTGIIHRKRRRVNMNEFA
jgi:hypothetical protein